MKTNSTVVISTVSSHLGTQQIFTPTITTVIAQILGLIVGITETVFTLAMCAIMKMTAETVQMSESALAGIVSVTTIMSSG